MSLRVRSLTHDEQAELAKILLDLQTHADGCERCQNSRPPRDMCADGAELYGRWEKWLAADSAEWARQVLG